MSLDADAMVDRRRLKRRLAFWRVAAALLAAAAIAAVWFQTRPGEYAVGRLEISGFIVEDAERDRLLRRLAGDDRVRALLVRINSPGGSVAGSEELFLALREVAAAKPVVALIGTVGASGGYITALGAERIYARETSLTGSIGALLQSFEATDLLESLGVRPVTIKSAPLKGTPSPLEALSPDARTALQQVIDDSYAWFLGIVRERRQLTGAELAAVADGRIMTGRQARDARLVDAIGGEAEARDWLASERDVSAELPTVDLDLDQDVPLATRLIRGVAGNILNREPLILDGLLALWHP